MTALTGTRRALLIFAGVLVALVGVAVAGTVGSAAGTVPLSIRVVGNHFVNGAGQTIRLLGVDRPGTEYACEEGWGYSSGAIDASDAAAIAAWHANAVRIPLNEDCWLGINGEPAYGSVAGYQQAIEDYVADLNADGIYAILDLHWSAPGTTVADGQRSMPDDHSAAFWTSVADTFKDNPAVLFDAFNEPFSPADDGSAWADYPVSWSCWENGGCTVPDAADGDTPDPSETYTAVGMQAMVDAIRATGATQPIILGGLSYANDLSGWLASEPSDPDHQLAADFHNYDGEACDTTSCWNSEIAPVAAQVPVVTGEFDMDAGSDCSDTGTEPGNFDNTFMNWADAHGVSYVAWGWYVLGGSSDCLYLITSASGTPAAPNGVALHDHLAALASTTTTTTTTTTSTGPSHATVAAVTRALRRFETLPTRAALLREGAIVVRFSAPVAGQLSVEVRRGSALVASLEATFARAGTHRHRVRLTAAGRRLLRGHRGALELSIDASYRFDGTVGRVSAKRRLGPDRSRK